MSNFIEFILNFVIFKFKSSIIMLPIKAIEFLMFLMSELESLGQFIKNNWTFESSKIAFLIF